MLGSLGSGPSGLSGVEAQARLERYGPNRLEEKRPSHIRMFLNQFRNVLVYILFAAAVITLLIGDLKDFVIIVVLILFNATIGFWQEVKAEASIQALKKLTETRSKVLRDGQMVEVSSTELVPGDVVVMSEGDLVSADARLMDSVGLLVDESSMTGESLPVQKRADQVLAEDALPFELINCLISGTVVVRGSGRALVTATGKDAYIATIAERAEEASPESPLTKALATFSKRYVALIIVAIVAMGAVALAQGRDTIDVFYLLIAQLVSAVPEGLPLVITLVTVIGAMTLSRRKTLTRYLPAVETLGSATVVATDKTGTVTEGRLIVDDLYEVDEGRPPLRRPLQRLRRRAGRWRGRGSGKMVGGAYSALRSGNPRLWSLPFDANLRMMASFNRTERGERLFVKGAFESLRERSQGGEDLSRLEQEVDRLSEEELRVLAFGVGNGSEDPSTWSLRIVGLLGFLDPPKAQRRRGSARCAEGRHAGHHD